MEMAIEFKRKSLNAIQEFKVPETLTDLRSFQGMANQLAPFNRDLATAISNRFALYLRKVISLK